MRLIISLTSLILLLLAYGTDVIKFASLSPLCQVGETLSSWAGLHLLSARYKCCTWSILISAEFTPLFALLNMKFRFTARLLCCQISGVWSDGAVPKKARLSLVFHFNRAESEFITIPLLCLPRGNIFRLYRPIPSGFTAFRSIDRSVVVRRARSTDQRLSYQRNQLTINQELASSAFPSPFTLPPSPSVCFRLRRTPPSPSPASKLQI